MHEQNSASNQSGGPLGRRQAVRALLEARDMKGIAALAKRGGNVNRTMSSLLFDHDPLIRWRAIEALGIIAQQNAATDLNKVRREIRRLLWLMNDESGGLCWVAPEAIGEILYCVPKLIDEYAPILPSFFEEEPFERGSRWAVARAASARPEPFQEARPKLIESLSDPDPVIRGYSILALGATGGGLLDEIKQLADDNSPLTLYDFDSGELVEWSVGALAKAYPSIPFSSG